MATVCTGRTRQERGHRFNPNKLLIDPYAKQIIGQVRWSDSLFGYRMGHRREDLSYDTRDNASGDAEVPRDRWRLQLGRRSAADDGDARQHHLRAACERLHQAASSRCLRNYAAHMRGWRRRL